MAGKEGVGNSYKAEILAKFASGISHKELCKLYPQIPRTTIITWCKKYQLANPQLVATNNATSDAPKLISIDGGRTAEETDLRLVRQGLRRIAKDPNLDPPVARYQIAAMKVLLEIPKLKSTIPKHILDEQEQSARDVIKKDLSEMTLQEKQDLIKRFYREDNED